MRLGKGKTIWGMALLMFALSACAKQAGTEESRGEFATQATATLKAEDQKPETLKFALVTKDANNTYMKKMEEGFVKACEEFGVEGICHGPAGTDSTSQIALIRSLIEQKVAGIAVAANDADALHEVLQEAMDAGIYVISLDSAVNKEDRILHIQQAEPERVGRVLLQAAYSMIDGKGTVGLITTTGSATNQNLWVEWMKQEIQDFPELYAELTLLPEELGYDDYDKTVECTWRLLAEHPELDIIITPAAASMVPVGNTLRESGREVLFTGLGLPSEMAVFIENDKSCPWFYLWNPIDLGYLSAYTLKALAAKEISGDIGDKYIAGELGARSVRQGTDGGTEVILGDPIKFDETNISLWKTVY